MPERDLNMHSKAKSYVILIEIFEARALATQIFLNHAFMALATLKHSLVTYVLQIYWIHYLYAGYTY